MAGPQRQTLFYNKLDRLSDRTPPRLASPATSPTPQSAARAPKNARIFRGVATPCTAHPSAPNRHQAIKNTRKRVEKIHSSRPRQHSCQHQTYVFRFSSQPTDINDEAIGFSDRRKWLSTETQRRTIKTDQRQASLVSRKVFPACPKDTSHPLATGYQHPHQRNKKR